MPISLLLIDDHRLLIETWRDLLSRGNDFIVGSIAYTPEDAKEELKIWTPDVIVCDINLGAGKESGFKLVPRLRALRPKVPILAVSGYAAPAIVKKMLDIGAGGYVSKHSPFEELVAGITAVYNKEPYLCSYTLAQMAELVPGNEMEEAKIAILTEKELVIMQKVRDGFSSAEIGEYLDISSKTVDAHRYHILRKLDIPNTAALLGFMQRHGL